MNGICDMTLFVVVVLALDETSATIAENFMQRVLLKFEICHFLILDDGSPFKGSFIAMGNILNINHNTLAKSNHNAFLSRSFITLLIK